MKFNEYKSFSRLKELSKNPIDLTENGVLTPNRIHEMQAENCGFKLFYGTERVCRDTLDALFSLAKESSALEKMQAMQAGEIVNKIVGVKSENRAVLHTATRDFFENRIEAKNAKHASDLAYREIEKLKSFMKELDKSSFTDLIQIGIGGSDLGPRALYLALEAYQIKGRRVHFISNVDPDDAASVLAKVDLSKTLIVTVSKSGTTLETLTNEAFVREALKKKGLKAKDHMIAVTGKGSPMDDPSAYRASFYIWDYIGGRYSATSMVGGVMLSFALGIDRFLEILKGASLMDKVALSKDMESNLPLLSALLGIWNRNFLGYPTVAIIPYSQALIRFPAHLQQLDMESNGKSIDKEGHFVSFETGPVVWGEIGTNGQHSFYQLIHQGTSQVPVEFIGFKNSQRKNDLLIRGTTSEEKLLANLFAQSIALAKGQKSENPNQFFPGNRPNSILFGTSLDPLTLGCLLSFYEHKVAFQGFIWNINSFDQEGVQLGKVLADKIIDLFIAKREKKQGDFPLGEAYLDS